MPKIGEKYGRLLIIDRFKGSYKSGRPKIICRCQCDCGKIKDIDEAQIRVGHTRSCGCLNSELSAKRKYKGPNDYHQEGNLIYISLYDGTEAIIDAEDYPKIKDFRWSHAKNGYAISRKTDHGHMHLLHREVLGLKTERIVVDHLNGNPLDNRKENLRICSQEGNTANAVVSKRNSTGYRGVGKLREGCWIMQITKRGQYYSSRHSSPEEAARAYDTKAIELRGPYSCINFPEEHPDHLNRRPARRMP